MKISFTVFPNISDIFNDSKVEGTYFPDSMALMVCRLTPMASANCCWVICLMAQQQLAEAIGLMALSTLNVLVIVAPPKFIKFNVVLYDEQKQYHEQVYKYKIKILHVINQHSAYYQ